MRTACAAALLGVVALTVSGCTSTGGASGSAAPRGSSASAASPSAASSAASPAASPAASATSAGDTLAGIERGYHRVVAEVLPSVVQIRTSSGLGSGIVFDDAGDIVTNAHVVRGATSFRVDLSTGGRSLPATLVGSYPPDDIAVLHVSDGGQLKPATFADSAQVQVGDLVLAIGSPLGLTASVTNGVVSAVSRTVSEPAEGGVPGATLPDVIQTSAAINPGNSGGALVSIEGQVIGIPTLAATDAQLGGAAPGIGFAIPSNLVKDIGGQLVKHGHVVDSHRAAIGARVATVAGPDGSPAGVGVVDVTPGGPAQQAGLQAGDIIVKVDGTSTPSTAALSAVLARHKPGDKVPVTVRRQGAAVTKTVVLGELPTTAQ